MLSEAKHPTSTRAQQSSGHPGWYPGRGAICRAPGGWLQWRIAEGGVLADAAMEARPGRLLIIGAIAGLLSGLFGIGGAVFLVPALTGVVKLSQHQAHGTSLATVPLVAITSGLIYGLSGNLDLWLSINIALTSTIGAVVGARVMHRLPAMTLRRIFAAFLFLVGLRMLQG